MVPEGAGWRVLDVGQQAGADEGQFGRCRSWAGHGSSFQNCGGSGCPASSKAFGIARLTSSSRILWRGCGVSVLISTRFTRRTRVVDRGRGSRGHNRSSIFWMLLFSRASSSASWLADRSGLAPQFSGESLSSGELSSSQRWMPRQRGDPHLTRPGSALTPHPFPKLVGEFLENPVTPWLPPAVKRSTGRDAVP